jgi:hypothetical protein
MHQIWRFLVHDRPARNLQSAPSLEVHYGSRARLFFRESTQSWYVKLSGRFVRLGKDELEARKRQTSLVSPECWADRDDYCFERLGIFHYLA